MTHRSVSRSEIAAHPNRSLLASDYLTEADEAAAGDVDRAYRNWQEQIAKGETHGVQALYERAYRRLAAVVLADVRTPDSRRWHAEPVGPSDGRAGTAWCVTTSDELDEAMAQQIAQHLQNITLLDLVTLADATQHYVDQQQPQAAKRLDTLRRFLIAITGLPCPRGGPDDAAASR